MPELKDFTSSVAVLVSSCDSFFDAWRPFTVFFRKFWPDCPFKIFLIVNQLRIRSSLLQPIAVGPDRGWSSNLQLALSQITHPYVLYIQEDYFLTEPVQRNQLGADFESAFESDADSLCFRARTHIDRGFAPINERFGVVPPDSDGRTRCQVTLWKRTALQSILRSDETAWNFEARGSERTTDLRILSYAHRENAPIRYLMSAISRGLWMPEALALCREHRVEIDPFFRPAYSPRAWQRRLRRAIGRSRLRRQLAMRHGQILVLE
jgi:hypothetical protein